MKVYILTNRYPYGKVEESFIGDELNAISHLIREKKISVILVPLIKDDYIRLLPEGVKLLTGLAEFYINRRRLFMKSLFVKDFWLELLKGLFSGSWNLSSLKTLVSFFGQAKITCEYLETLKISDKDGVLYSYWFDSAAYAIGKVNAKVKISRAHGYDLYKERRKNQFMVMNKSYYKELDYIIPISNQGKQYLQSTYSIEAEKLSLNYLGVDECEAAIEYEKGVINFVSVSVLEENKQVDTIQVLLEDFSDKTDHSVYWHHFGGKGDEVDTLKLSNRSSKLKAHYYGNCDKVFIMKTISQLPTRIFINNSISEGVPVSIMEAMMLKTPVIAPCIGGIPEMLSSENGYVFDGKLSLEKLEFGVCHVLTNYQDLALKSYDIWLEKFNSKKNYIDFYKFLISCVR